MLMKKRVLSCIQPTNEMHIGNYFGAVTNWVSLQEKYNCIYGVVDLHVMTMPYSPKNLYNNTQNMIIDLIACGIDPEKSQLFIQSMIPEHTELTWILNCVTSYGGLSRMTQFKDKSELLQSGAKDNFISAGLFTYPVLQAADILVYRADYVPVGKDQEQHLELSRNIAMRFNNQFGEFFPLPQPLFTDVPKLLSLADPSKKMSKSLGSKHYVGLFEEEASIRKKVRSAVTDIGGNTSNEMSPGVKNLFELLRACKKTEIIEVLKHDYGSGTLKYSILKDEVANALVELTSSLREKKSEIEANIDVVNKVIKESTARTRELAAETITEVRKICGLPVR